MTANENGWSQASSLCVSERNPSTEMRTLKSFQSLAISTSSDYVSDKDPLNSQMSRSYDNSMKEALKFFSRMN